MLHDTGFKRRLLSGTFLVLSMSLASGCGVNYRSIGDLTGEERTLPDDDVVDFSNRHTPVLNPSTNRSLMPSDDQASSMTRNMAPSPVPQQRAALDGGYAASAAASGRQVPVENQTLLASVSPATMSAPVSAVTASSAPPASYIPAANAAVNVKSAYGVSDNTAAVASTGAMKTASAGALPASPIPGGTGPGSSNATFLPISTASAAPIETLSMPAASAARDSGATGTAVAPTAAAEPAPVTDSSVAAAGIANAPLETAAPAAAAMAEPQKTTDHGWFYHLFHTSASPSGMQTVPDASSMQAQTAFASGPPSQTSSFASPPSASAKVAVSASPDGVPAPVAVGDLKPSDSAGASPASIGNPASAKGSLPAPTLASVPLTPDATPKDQSAAQYTKLIAEHNQSETAREHLMDNSGATVMTSPKNGQLVSDAANVPAPSSDLATPPDATQTPLANATKTDALPASATAAVSAPKPDSEHGWLPNASQGDAANAGENASIAAVPGGAAVPTQNLSTAPAGNMAGTSAPTATSDNAISPSGEPLPAGTALPQPGGFKSEAAAVARPEGTEVVPHVILGAPPAFPPAPSETAPSAERFSSPLPPAGVASTPPATADASGSTVSVSATPALLAPDVVNAPAPTPSEVSVQASAGSVSSAPVPGGGKPSGAAVEPSVIPPALSSSQEGKHGVNAAVPAGNLPTDNANAPLAVDPAKAAPAEDKSASAGSALPDVSQLSGDKDAPLTLVPPSGSNAGRFRNLPNSPYAHRSQDATEGSN